MTITGLDPTLERALDLAGVFVFALSGAALGARRRFDIVGIAVLAFVTALGGGLIRDTLLGDTPPAALRDQWYLAMPIAATVVTLVGLRLIDRIRRPVLVFDAGGLALFCVVGTAKSLDLGLGVVSAVLLGVVSAVGGGVLRDVLARDVPAIFTSDTGLYAIPAALGASTTALLASRDALGPATVLVTVLAVFVLRIVAIRRGWRAPLARGSE